MKKLIRHMKMRTRLMLLIILVSGLSLGSITVLLYGRTERTIKKQAMSSFGENVQKTCAILDSKLEVIKEATEKLNLDTRIYDIFEKLNREDELELYRASKEIAVILRDAIPWYSNMYSAHLVTSYYRFGEEDKNYYPNFTESEIAQKAYEAEGRIVWIPTYSYTNMYGIENLTDQQLSYGNVFSVARWMNLSDVTSGKVKRLRDIMENPVMVVNFKPEYLEEILVRSGINNSLEDMDYLIAADQGMVVYSTDSSYGINSPYDAEWLLNLEDDSDYGGFQIRESGQEYILSYSRSEITGWLVIMKIPVKSLIGDLRGQYISYILAAYFLLMIVAATFAWLTSKYITGHFYRVVGMIERIGDGDFEQRIRYDEKDEFAFFYEKLNQMNQDIQRLIHENYEVKLMQKETEIRALNTQLNPHFIYNTLNVINWTCLEGNMDDTSRMLVNLSRMLQYTAYHKNVMELLCDDLEWLRQYLFIMQVRFEQKFEVNVDIPEKLMEIKVPKLFLQPFVENAIVHGFEYIGENGLLEIYTEIEEDAIFFYVEDNGCGMTPEKIQQVMDAGEHSGGIANVHKRMQILYGKEYGVEIYSQAGEGTAVRLRIPR